MIAMLALALMLQQERAPTVGDTVWVITRVPLAPRQIVRPQPWDLGDLGQVLGPPRVDLSADSAVIRYPVAFWYPGDHEVTVPGPIVVNPEGRSDTLPSLRLTVAVRSILPAGVNRDSLAPRPPAAPVPQTRPSLLPLGIALTLATIIATMVGWRVAGRRRPLVVAPPAPPPAPDLPRLLDAWAATGETRAAVDGWSHLVEAAAIRRAAAEGDDSAAGLVQSLEIIGFRPDPTPGDIDRTIQAAKSWLGRDPQ